MDLHKNLKKYTGLYCFAVVGSGVVTYLANGRVAIFEDLKVLVMFVGLGVIVVVAAYLEDRRISKKDKSSVHK